MANTQLYLILFTALNIFLSSNAKYIGTPKKVSDLRVPLKSSLVLTCQYNGTDDDDDGQFVGWYKDNETISNDKSEHYTVKKSEKELKLTITITEGDQEVKKWYVKTDKSDENEPIECQFGQISFKPSPQRMETNRVAEKLNTDNTSVRRLQGESINFKCIIEPSQPNQVRKPQIRWRFSKNGEKFTKLPDGVRNISGDEIAIERINKTHRGYYRCSLNTVSFSALLRVKDPLAALWPFLGIVTTVLILVIIILIYEKRQKLARKAGVVEDEVNDNANDPLVQSSNKLSDDENKKHTVKA